MIGRTMFGAAIAAAIGSGGLTAQPVTAANVLAYGVAGMRDVDVLRGRPYRTVDSAAGRRALTLDAYRRRGTGAAVRRPALIFVHGGLVAGAGGPLPTEWPAYQSWGRLAAAMGLVGITFNHRLTTNDNVGEASDDLRAAIEYVRSHAPELTVDPERLCLAFYSASGPLSSLPLRERPPYIRCVVLFYPFLDLEHMRGATQFRAAHDAAHVDSLVPRYSPAALIGLEPATLPPIFLAMAGNDAIPKLNESIVRFMTAALGNRVSIDFALHSTGEHGFDQRNHDARAREIIETVLAFVRRHVADGQGNRP